MALRPGEADRGGRKGGGGDRRPDHVMVVGISRQADDESPRQQQGDRTGQEGAKADEEAVIAGQRVQLPGLAADAAEGAAAANLEADRAQHQQQGRGDPGQQDGRGPRSRPAPSGTGDREGGEGRRRHRVMLRGRHRDHALVGEVTLRPGGACRDEFGDEFADARDDGVRCCFFT